MFTAKKVLKVIVRRRLAVGSLILLFLLSSLLFGVVSGAAYSISKTLSQLEAQMNNVIVDFMDGRILSLGDVIGFSPPSTEKPSYVNESLVHGLLEYLREQGFPVDNAYCVLDLNTMLVYRQDPISRYLACEDLEKAKTVPLAKTPVTITIVQGGQTTTTVMKPREIAQAYKRHMEELKRLCEGKPLQGVVIDSSFRLLIADRELLEKGVRVKDVSLSVVEGEVPRSDHEVLLPVVYRYNKFVTVKMGDKIPLVFHVPFAYIKVWVKVSGFIPVYHGRLLVTTPDVFRNMFNVSRKICNVVVVSLTKRLNLLESIRLKEAIENFFAGRVEGKVHVSYPLLEVERIYRGKAFTLTIMSLLSRFSPALMALLGVLAGYMVFSFTRDLAELLSRYGWSFASIYLPLVLVFMLLSWAGLALSAIALMVGWDVLYKGVLTAIGFELIEAYPFSSLAASIAYNNLMVYAVSYMAAGLLTMLLLVYRLAPLKPRGEG